jgi:hypothetical protein
MNSVEQMAEFVFLWDKVQAVHLTNVSDSIHWRWTSSGTCSSKSAYKIQFQGSYCSFSSAIWSASVEGKHKFFAWLMVQNKILTADNLVLRS